MAENNESAPEENNEDSEKYETDESDKEESGSDDDDASNDTNTNKRVSNVTADGAINVNDIDIEELCDTCVKRYHEFNSNVFQNKAWMVWETFMNTLDFALDVAVIVQYWRQDKIPFAIILLIILIMSEFVHIWASNRAGHPKWVGFLAIGTIYECYQSWGEEKPTVKWDKFRYRHAVAEALPQTIVQAIFIDAARAITENSTSKLPLFSMIISISNLCYTITEKATSSETEDRVYFIEAIVKAPCSIEALCRIGILIYYFTDTALRVLALSLFLNISNLGAWRYIVLIFLLSLFTFFAHQPTREYTLQKWLELLAQGGLNLLVSHGLLKMKSGRNIGSHFQSILLEYIINFVLIGVFLYHTWNETIFIIASTLIGINFVVLFPSIWYMLNKFEIQIQFEKQRAAEKSTLLKGCQCGRNLFFANLTCHQQTHTTLQDLADD